MASVLLRFQLALLEAAEAKAKAALLSIQTTKGIAADLKRDLTQGAREKLIEARALKSNLLDTLRTQKKKLPLVAAARGTPDALDLEDGQVGDIARALRRGRKGFMDFVGNPLVSAASGNPAGAILGLAGELGGPFVKLLTGLVTQQVLAMVDEKIAQEVELRMATLSARLEEERYQQDYQRRLKDEPDFRRAEARRDADEISKDEEQHRALGWGRSADFLDGI